MSKDHRMSGKNFSFKDLKLASPSKKPITALLDPYLDNQQARLSKQITIIQKLSLLKQCSQKSRLRGKTVGKVVSELIKSKDWMTAENQQALACIITDELKKNSITVEDLVVGNKNFQETFNPIKQLSTQRDSSFGVTAASGIRGSDLCCVLKYVVEGRKENDLLHDIAVGLVLNTVREYTPCFMYTYGGFLCAPMIDETPVSSSSHPYNKVVKYLDKVEKTKGNNYFVVEYFGDDTSYTLAHVNRDDKPDYDVFLAELSMINKKNDPRLAKYPEFWQLYWKYVIYPYWNLEKQLLDKLNLQYQIKEDPNIVLNLTTFFYDQFKYYGDALNYVLAKFKAETNLAKETEAALGPNNIDYAKLGNELELLTKQYNDFLNQPGMKDTIDTLTALYEEATDKLKDELGKKNFSPKNLCDKSRPDSMDVFMVTELIRNSNPKTKPMSLRTFLEGEAYDVREAHAVFVQLIFALGLAHALVGFMHMDLHYENIRIHKLNTKTKVRVPYITHNKADIVDENGELPRDVKVVRNYKDKTRYIIFFEIETLYVPQIIDYGFAVVTYDNITIEGYKMQGFSFEDFNDYKRLFLHAFHGIDTVFSKAHNNYVKDLLANTIVYKLRESIFDDLAKTETYEYVFDGFIDKLYEHIKNGGSI